jgi:hypothetical protein
VDDPVERGFAVAAVRALGTRAEAVCARRSPALRRFAAQLAKDPAALAAEAERLDAPVPAGLNQIHPSWYEPAPPSSRREAQAWLERRAYGRLVPMELQDASPRLRRGSVLVPSGDSLSDRLESADAAALVELLETLGRRRVAIAFSAAPRTALAQLCARLGEPSASQLLEQVRKTRASSDEVKEAQRAMFHVEAEAGSLFLRAGAAWLGPALASRGTDRLRRVAQRMTRDAGELLLRNSSPAPSEADASQALSVAAALLAPAPSRA